MHNHNPHWTQVDPLKVTTPISSGVKLPRVSTNLPTVYTFKYRVGDIFLDPTEGNIIEITNFNYIDNCYTGKVEIKYDGGNKSTTMFSKLIYEYALDKMERYDSMNAMVEQQKKKNGITYKIHYIEKDPNSTKIKGEKVNHTNMTMTGIRALAKMLNSMVKRNPNRRIIMVSIVDDNDKFLTHVRFMPQEISQQKFLTGMKERLLAHAKHELGYEVVT